MNNSSGHVLELHLICINIVVVMSHECHGISDNRQFNCMFSSLLWLTNNKNNNKTQSLTLLALCEGNPPVTGGFPSQRASNAEIFSISWCLHDHCVVKWFRVPDSKVHGANMGPIWGRQDPRGPHVGPMNLVIWGIAYIDFVQAAPKMKQIKIIQFVLFIFKLTEL